VTKPPGVSPNLLMADVLVDRIRQDVEVAERRGIDVANLVLSPPVPLLGPSVSDAQACVPPFPMSADREAETSHRPSAVTDEIDTINAAEDTGTAGDTDDLEVHYGPLTGREWVALGECVETHDLRRDPDDHRPGEPQYRPEFLRLVEFHHVPFAQLRDRVMAEDAGRPWLRRAGDADHAGGVQ